MCRHLGREGVLHVYRELALLEEEEECLRRRAGDRLLRRGGVRRRGDLDFCRPPDLLRRRAGERRRGEPRRGDPRRPRGEGDRRRRGDGERRRGDGERRRRPGDDRRFGEARRAGARCIRTGAHEISCPSICPPSMCFMAFWASSGVWNSTYAKPLLSQGRFLSPENSISLILPKVPKISSRCALRTFLVSRPTCTLTAWGVAERARALPRPFDLEREAERRPRLLSRDLDLEGDPRFFGGGEAEERFLADGGEAERLRGGGLPLRGGGLPLRGGGLPFLASAFFSGFLSGSFLSLLGFSPFFFLSFFLSRLRLLLESELLLLESLLLLELLLELLCFLFFFPLSLSRLFLLSSSESLLLLLEEERPRFFFSSFFFSSDFSAGGADPPAMFFK